MEFKVNTQIHDLASVKHKIESALLELSVRENNVHVGTGLGGNQEQLLILSSIEHVLTDEHDGVFFREGFCYWNARSILNASMKEIRSFIDEAFKYQSQDSNTEIVGVAIKHLLDEGYRSTLIDSFNRSISDIDDVLCGKDVDTNSMSMSRMLITSLCVVGLVSRKLDAITDASEATRLPEMQFIGTFFRKVEPSIVLISIRKMMGIERIVKFNLDEHPVLGDVLTNISRSLRDN